MNKKRNLAIKKLEKAFPGIKGIRECTESWFPNEDAIHLGDCAEGGTINDLPACDYYAFEIDPEEKIYVMGVHKELRELVKQCGYAVECYDPGTWVAYANND